MKKIFIFMLCIVFLVGTVSAFNVKNFDNKIGKYGKITIDERKWYDPFGWVFEKNIIEKKLNVNTEKCLINCYSEGVSTLYKNMPLFESMKFEDRSGNIKSINSNIFIKKNVSKNIFGKEKIYKIIDGKNISVIKWNNWTDTKEEWVKYNFEVLTAGTYEWRIEGKKGIKESIDWIGTTGGKELREWAWWDSYDGVFTIYNTTGPDTFTVPAGVTNISVLTIAGGGGGGGGANGLGGTGSGAGAGGMIFNGSYATTPSETINLHVGAGGTGGASGTRGVQGTFSFFGVTNTTGGGYGTQQDDIRDGGDGGSGGGVPGTGGAGDPGTGIASQGNNGGDNQQSNPYPPGGGGGKGAVGGTGSGSQSGVGGAGGVVWGQTFAGGGGGGSSGEGATRGDGGTGGGGDGGDTGSGYDGVNGYGGGGGGGRGASTGYTGGDGGDGIVIVRYLIADIVPVIKETHPANLTTYTITNIIEFSANISDDSGNLDNSSFYLDGTLNQTNSSIVNGSEWNITLTLSEGTYDWYYDAWDNASQQTIGDGMRFTINTEPTINIKSPIVNNTNYTTSTIFFNATNSTPISTWIINYNGTNITLSDINTSRTVADGTYQLFIYANNSVSGKFGLNNSIYFTVDTTAPAVNITNPLNETIVTNFTKSLDLVILLNYTATDLNLDSCKIFNISSGVNFTSPTCLNQSFRTVFDTYTFIAEANDTFGNNAVDYETAKFDYNLLQNNFSFTNITLEAVSNTFTYDLNVSNGITISAIDLIYNNTSYPTSLATSGSNVISTVDVTSPLITTQTNISFHWNITQSDGFIFNTTNYTQTVNLLQIDNCSSYTTHIYNFTIIDEELQTNLANTTTDINLDVYTLDRGTKILNFSRSYPENPVQVCLSGNILAGNEFSLDSIIKYQATNYEIEYYNIVNFTLSNSSIPQLINLFDLATADSTEFQITFKDSNFIVVEGALVHILRQYVAENNTFKTVELPSTDSNGQTVAHFVEKDIIYNILVTNGTTGEVLGSFNNIIAFCQDATIGDCVINLNALTSGKSVYDYNTDLKIGVSNLIYNGTTRDLSVDFFTFDGTSKTINLTAFQYDQLGNSTACSNTLTSSGGSISCNIPNSFGNASMSIFLYVDGDLIFTDFVAIDTDRDFGDAGYLILFLMILAMVVMFSESKTGMIVAVMVGMISGILFSLATGKIIGLGSAIIWLIIAGSVLIWKLNKDKN